MQYSTKPLISVQIDARSRAWAILLICCATGCFATLDTTAKYLNTRVGVPVFQIVWLRFMSHVLLNHLVLGRDALKQARSPAKLGWQIARSAFMLGATVFNFLALQYLQLDQTATVQFLAPFIVAALAGPFLGEWVGWRRLIAICVGFSGVLLVIRPGFGGVHWAISFSFLSTLNYAFYILTTRYLAAYDPPETTQLFSPLAGAVLMLPFALWVWTTPPTLLSAFLLFSLGFWGGFGHWLLIVAHKYAPAPVLAPFGYINIIFMISLEATIFGDLPSEWTLAGAAIIIMSGVYLLFRERQMSRSAIASSARVTEG